MSIKEYKYSVANKWNGDATNEIKRAVKFMVGQVKKSPGWTVQQAIEQTENQYGYLITNAVLESIERVLRES